MKSVTFKIDEEEEQMIEALKGVAKTKTRTRVFRFCLNKTFEFFKQNLYKPKDQE